jgi:hypothetical protein
MGLVFWVTIVGDSLIEDSIGTHRHRHNLDKALYSIQSIALMQRKHAACMKDKKL